MNNPYTPGPGQQPPYLAGRKQELEFFRKLLQSQVVSNLLITGLRGVGKTVLLKALKQEALSQGWLWAGSDLSESSGMSEAKLSEKLVNDLAGSLSSIFIEPGGKVGYDPSPIIHAMQLLYGPNLNLNPNKLKELFTNVWKYVEKESKFKGIIIAFDEAQLIADRAPDREYPLSVLIDLINYLQQEQLPFILVLAGLPNINLQLAQARGYAERMFSVMHLDKLSSEESKDAILIPLKKDKTSLKMTAQIVAEIVDRADGYPYFIQYFAREIYDAVFLQSAVGHTLTKVNIDFRNIDKDYYHNRWSACTEKQREMMKWAACVPFAKDGFTIKDLTDSAANFNIEIKPSATNLMLQSLIDDGMIYKNKRGTYAFAIPMFEDYIRRQMKK